MILYNVVKGSLCLFLPTTVAESLLELAKPMCFSFFTDINSPEVPTEIIVPTSLIVDRNIQRISADRTLVNCKLDKLATY